MTKPAKKAKTAAQKKRASAHDSAGRKMETELLKAIHARMLRTGAEIPAEGENIKCRVLRSAMGDLDLLDRIVDIILDDRHEGNPLAEELKDIIDGDVGEVENANEEGNAVERAYESA